MQDNELKEKSCTNCKYYIEHYVCSMSTQFFPIGGHCVNTALNPPHKRKRYELHDNCEHWEINDSVKEKRKKSIEEVLRSMEKHLSDIKSILEIDNK